MLPKRGAPRLWTVCQVWLIIGVKPVGNASMDLGGWLRSLGLGQYEMIALATGRLLLAALLLRTLLTVPSARLISLWLIPVARGLCA